jgi:Mn-dependent DtxR family transcriptional regulator
MNSHKNKIIELLKKEEVVTSSEVARFLKISWNTAEKYLLELALDGKVRRKRKEGGTLWLKA